MFFKEDTRSVETVAHLGGGFKGDKLQHFRHLALHAEVRKIFGLRIRPSLGDVHGSALLYAPTVPPKVHHDCSPLSLKHLVQGKPSPLTAFSPTP